ncbi:hypothetical protein CHLRE_16g669525v5 [Chlamydomonas reinhardtii]|uniref:ABC transporter domain-containing protein n=1 Tax=Chlamydomonas reinhardtii TaxID=3055 RepID=A0A2K3CUG6_CHLRE|nr:uncharacterized protein CHLRE_16g669525v5 [Chlamydomonas reinhardtii]PNW71925.1 hypothetical protein CHLRE_16g669525v5 [Chlamydomonas reinhardtii]
MQLAGRLSRVSPCAIGRKNACVLRPSLHRQHFARSRVVPPVPAAAYDSRRAFDSLDEIQNPVGTDPLVKDLADALQLTRRRAPFDNEYILGLGLNLVLPHGRTTALVGLSGAGKSTVAGLLSRFYEPQEGSILLDGRPISSFSRGEWAKAVSLVSQDPVLFSGTIADNIAYGDQEEITAAATAANAHDFIMKLPDGYRTVVGERGTLLSGGQRQRIALARAIIKDSPIILLDEATSALDVLSERLVQQAINRLVKGRTVLVIAHRLATVQAADQIVVMRNGQAVEMGTHDELIARPNSHYTELMSVQNLSMAST